MKSLVLLTILSIITFCSFGQTDKDYIISELRDENANLEKLVYQMKVEVDHIRNQRNTELKLVHLEATLTAKKEMIEVLKEIKTPVNSNQDLMGIVTSRFGVFVQFISFIGFIGLLTGMIIITIKNWKNG